MAGSDQDSDDDAPASSSSAREGGEGAKQAERARGGGETKEEAADLRKMVDSRKEGRGGAVAAEGADAGSKIVDIFVQGMRSSSKDGEDRKRRRSKGEDQDEPAQEVEGGKVPISQRLGKIRRDAGEKSVRKGGGGGGGGTLSVTVNLS